MATKERSTKQVVDDTRLHLKELVDAHVELAKVEVTGAIGEVGKAIAPFVVAAVLALYLLAFYAVTAAKAISIGLPEWAAWLIVSGALTLIILLLALVGRSKLKKLDTSPKETQESVKQTVAWAKARTNKADS